MSRCDRVAATGVPVHSERTVSEANALARTIVATHTRRGFGPALVGRTGVAAGRRYPLPEPGEQLIIGRGAECDLVLLDAELSRTHVAVSRTANGTKAVDLGTKNGTFIDPLRAESGPVSNRAELSGVTPARLTKHVAYPLHHGDCVRIGTSVLQYVDPTEFYLRQLDGWIDGPISALPRNETIPSKWSPQWLPTLIAQVLIAAAAAGLIWLLV